VAIGAVTGRPVAPRWQAVKLAPCYPLPLTGRAAVAPRRAGRGHGLDRTSSLTLRCARAPYSPPARASTSSPVKRAGEPPGDVLADPVPMPENVNGSERTKQGLPIWDSRSATHPCKIF
jgi:hypothetical protein